MFIVHCKFCAEQEGGSHPCCPFICAAPASTMLLHFALREMSKDTFFRISTFSWLRKSILSYLSSVMWFYTKKSFPKFSVSFLFQGPDSFSESLLSLVGSFPSSFTVQPVLGCLYPHVAVDVALPVACGVIQLRSD